jgi:hypothetical protein
MRVTGPTSAIDDRTLCLAAGGSAEATVYVHEAAVTIGLTASAPMAEAMPSFVVHLGPYLVATNTLRTAQAETSVSRVAAERGEQVLRVMVPEKSAGGLCLHQVSITQP